MSEKIFQWLVRLYPRRFRSEYGYALRQLLRDRLAAETGISGPFALVDGSARRLRDVRTSPAPATHPGAAAEVGSYRISEEAFVEMKRRQIREYSMGLLSIAVGFLIAWFGHAPRWPLWAVYSIQTLPWIGALRGHGRLRDHWRGYERILDEDRVQQGECGVVTLALLKTEVTALDHRNLLSGIAGPVALFRDPLGCGHGNVFAVSHETIFPATELVLSGKRCWQLRFLSSSSLSSS